MTFSHALSSNNYGTAKFIVDSSAANGTHTTIASALTSASSGDTIFIRPGTYTENLTMKAGVNLAAYTCDALTPNVSIVGKCSFSSAGTVSISGIRLTTNSDNFLAVTGSAASVVNLINCYLNCSNNTGISFTTSNSSAAIVVYYCSGNIGTTGISYYTNSSSGILKIISSDLSNTGSSTTASSTSTGLVDLENSEFDFPMSTSSTGSLSAFSCKMDTTSTNTTCWTTAGSATAFASNCTFAANSGTAISVGTGTIVTLSNCDISSTNAAAISGAGTLKYTSLGFSNTSSTITTTTVTPFTPSTIFQQVRTSTSSLVRCTTGLPIDDTIPQNTEGTEVFTVTITPKCSSNILVIECNLFAAPETAPTNIGMALFQDSTANALAATAATCTNTFAAALVIRYSMSAGTTSATTFKIRAGGGQILDVNGSGSNTRLFGGVANAYHQVTEYSA